MTQTLPVMNHLLQKLSDIERVLQRDLTLHVEQLAELISRKVTNKPRADLVASHLQQAMQQARHLKPDNKPL